MSEGRACACPMDQHPEHVTWNPEVAAVVSDEAARAYPGECCGLLFGTGPTEVVTAEPIANAESDERRTVAYLLAPGEYRRAEQRARGIGLDVVGVFHSHPDQAAVPSDSDLAEAWPGWLYVIVPVEEGRAGVARGWRLRADRSAFDPVDLIHVA